MTLKDIKDFLKTQVTGFDSCTIGKIDTTKDKAICVYNRTGQPPVVAIGGRENSSYCTKKVCILLHYTSNCDIAERKAQEVYNIFKEQHVIGGKSAFFDLDYNEPIGLGTDEKNNYEFVIDMVIYYRK